MKIMVMTNDHSLTERIETSSAEEKAKSRLSSEVEFANYTELPKILEAKNIAVKDGENSPEMLAFLAGFNAFSQMLRSVITDDEEFTSALDGVGLSTKSVFLLFDRDEAHPKFNFVNGLGDITFINGGYDNFIQEVKMLENIQKQMEKEEDNG